MKPLSNLQRDLLVRRLEREIAWYALSTAGRESHRAMAHALVKGLEWTGVHGASEKRAVELIVARLDEAA